MGMSMRHLLLFFTLMMATYGQDAIEEVAPPEVGAAAAKEVAALGQQVVMGRYEVAIERMYPQWKARAAKRMGGMDNLKKELDGVAKRMLQQGISITDFKPSGEPRVYEVCSGKRVVKENGVEVEKLCYTKWMALVPTTTRFRMFLEKDPKPVVIESTGFQVAIADKGGSEWSFIDGSAVTVKDLRSLFFNLPVSLELPPLDKKQIK
jgi:hypothetical protein